MKDNRKVALVLSGGGARGMAHIGVIEELEKREYEISSIAIPGVITPVKEDKHLLVDGGVLNNIPMAHVKRQEGDLMVAVYVNADIPADLPKHTKDSEKKQKLYQKKLADYYAHLTKTFSSSGDADLGYFSLASTVFDLMTMRMAEDRIKEYAPEVLIRVSRESCNVFDFYKAEEQVEAGRRAAIKVLDTL